MTPAQKIADATAYLESEGGLGEMGMCAQAALEADLPFVAMSPAVAIATLALATEALQHRARLNGSPVAVSPSVN